MPFTDDDLKRLKEDMRPQKPWNYVRFDPDKIMALLVRLEAAEHLNKILNVCIDRNPFVQDAYESWRKAAEAAINEPHYVPCAETPCEQCVKILAWRKEAEKHG